MMVAILWAPTSSSVVGFSEEQEKLGKSMWSRWYNSSVHLLDHRHCVHHSLSKAEVRRFMESEFLDFYYYYYYYLANRLTRKWKKTIPKNNKKSSLLIHRRTSHKPRNQNNSGKNRISQNCFCLSMRSACMSLMSDNCLLLNSCPYLIRRTKSREIHSVLLYIINLIDCYSGNYKEQLTFMIKGRMCIALYHWAPRISAVDCPSQLWESCRLGRTCCCFLWSRCRLINQKSDYFMSTFQLRSKQDKQIKLNIALEKKLFPVVFLKISQAQMTVRNKNENTFFQVVYIERPVAPIL